MLTIDYFTQISYSFQSAYPPAWVPMFFVMKFLRDSGLGPHRKEGCYSKLIPVMY